MSTRGNIILFEKLDKKIKEKKILTVEDLNKLQKNGALVYNHFDSYIEDLGELLKEYINKKFKTTIVHYTYDLESIRLNLAFYIMFVKETKYEKISENFFNNHGVHLENFVAEDIEYLYLIDLRNLEIFAYDVSHDNDFNIESCKFIKKL